MNRPTILLIDALISLVLGIALVGFPNLLVESLGIPPAERAFYPSMLGTVTIGVALALLVEWGRRPGGRVGLGVGGAIAIDLCAALVLAGWLLFGDLALPIRGRILLWPIVLILLGVSCAGAVAQNRHTTA